MSNLDVLACKLSLNSVLSLDLRGSYNVCSSRDWIDVSVASSKFGLGPLSVKVASKVDMEAYNDPGLSFQLGVLQVFAKRHLPSISLGLIELAEAPLAFFIHLAGTVP